MKILVIDDDRVILEMVKKGLTYAGHSVFTEENGEAGLEFCQQQKPDLVLLDIMMPGIDGFEVCQRLKSNPETSDIMIFMLTSRTQIKDVELAFKLGADNYITKPFDLFGLDDLIQYKLDNAKAEAEQAEITGKEIEAVPLSSES